MIKAINFMASALFIYVLALRLFICCCEYGPSAIERGLQRTGTASYLWRFMDAIQLNDELKLRAEKAEADIERLQAQMDELRSQKNPSWPRSDGPYYYDKPWSFTNFPFATGIIYNVSAGQ